MSSSDANMWLAETANLAAVVKPMVQDSSGASPPSNSEVRKIGQDILGALKYSFASVASNPATPVRPNSVEALFKQAIEKTPAERRERYQRVATDLVNAPVNVRSSMFGRAGERSVQAHLGAGGFERFDEELPPLAIDKKLIGVRTSTISAPLSTLNATPEGLLIPAAHLPAEFENFQQGLESAEASAADSGVLADDRLAEIWGPTFVGDPFAETAPVSDFEEMQTTDKLGFWITQVKCVDETNPELPFSSDEIALAGVSIDENGDTLKISEKYIGGGFDDGNSKSYSNWRYHWFNLREGNVWPKTYVVTLILAEKDNGGLSDVLNTVWEKIGPYVKRKIADAVAAGVTPELGPIIGKIIGEAVAWVIGELVEWIINAFKDDMFPPFIAKVATPSMSARWNYPNGTWGNPSSGLRKAHFYGHGGHYYVQYYWKFFV